MLVHARSEGLRRLPGGAQLRRGTACRRRRRCVRGHVRVVEHASPTIIGSTKLRHEGGAVESFGCHRGASNCPGRVPMETGMGVPESAANSTDYEKPRAGVNVGVRPCGTVAMLSEVGSGQCFAFGAPSSENTATLRTHRQPYAEARPLKDPAKPGARLRTRMGTPSVSLAHRCAAAPPKADVGNEGLAKLRDSERD